jgi:hypothetical protein
MTKTSMSPISKETIHGSGQIRIRNTVMQCCESGIRCLFDPWIRDPGWIKIQDPIRNEHPESYFRELRNNFCVKILKFFDAALFNESIFLSTGIIFLCRSLKKAFLGKG